MNWLDLGIILFIIIFLIIGLKNGFMSSLLSNFSFKINALLSFFLCKPIALLFNSIFNLENSIMTSYSSKLINASPDFATNLLSLPETELGSFVSETINKSGFSGFTNSLTNLFLNKSSLYSTLHNSSHIERSLSDIISASYANFFVTIISFMSSLILIYLTVLLLKFIVKKLRTIGLVKAVDNILGMFYGLFRCLLIFITLSIIIKLMSGFTFMNVVVNYIHSSAIGNFIYGQISLFIDHYLNLTDLLQTIF